MADASASKNPRGMYTKKDKEDMMPKTSFSKLKRVGDTNISTVDIIQLRDRLKEGHSPMAKKISKCGTVQAATFPPTLPCPELVMECASQFDIVTKSIIFDEGKRVLANISGQVVEEVFNIPQHKGMILVLMDQARRESPGQISNRSMATLLCFSTESWAPLKLHLHSTKDYKIFYDAFAMKTVRVLQGTPARRLSREAKTKVKKYESWFIQFSQFTYIRVAGCTACPKRLPRYPPDRIVLMELATQLEQYDKMMKLKGETGVTFSLMIDNDSCPNPVAFAVAEKESEQYNLGWYRARQGFDPNGLIKASHWDPFRHIPTIEDFWANAQDDFHVRKLAFSRLSVGMMRAIRWRGLDIPNQLEDDEDVLREDYNTVEGTELSPMDWDHHQDPSLEAVTRAVDLHTEWWYNIKLRQLQGRKVHLTYEKMKPEEENPAESVGQQGGGSSQQQQQTVKGKKRSLEVEKGKEHQEPPTKK